MPAVPELFCTITGQLCGGNCLDVETGKICGDLLDVVGRQVAAHAQEHSLPPDMRQWPQEHHKLVVHAIAQVFAFTPPETFAAVNPDTLNQAITDRTHGFLDSPTNPLSGSNPMPTDET